MLIKDIRERFKKGEVTANDVRFVTNSSDFFEYWKKELKYSLDEIENVVYRNIPVDNKPVAFWCIAGGAIGNLVWSFLGETTPVINDIDVFVWIAGDGSSCVGQYYTGDTATFSSVARDGIYNIIYQEKKMLDNYYGVYTKEARDRCFNELISQFDFNSCMAFFQPYNNYKFGYEAPFIQFFKEKQLKIYGFQHPLSTIVRGEKKSEELGVKFEKHKVVEVLANIFSTIEIEKTHLGEKKKVALKSNPDLMKPWFEYDSKSETFNSILKENSLYKYSSKSNVFLFFKLPKHQRDNLEFLIENDFFEWSLLGSLIRAKKVKIPDFNKKEIEKLKPFVAAHNFSRYVDPNHIKEWVVFIKKVKQQAKDFGDEFENYFIGEVESELARRTALNERYQKNYIPCLDDIISRFKLTIKDDTEKSLSTPIHIGDDYNKNFTELCTKHSLRKEGLEMNHCVGGYSIVVESGQSHIFKIRLNDEKATLEVGLSNKGTESQFFYDKQLKGIKNSRVSKEMERLASDFIDNLNGKKKRNITKEIKNE